MCLSTLNQPFSFPLNFLSPHHQNSFLSLTIKILSDGHLYSGDHLYSGTTSLSAKLNGYDENNNAGKPDA
jgi:hypothetical protein